MGDVHFSCPACEQPLVVEETGAGMTIDCPQCGDPLQIPFAEPGKNSVRAGKTVSKWIHRSTELERQVYDFETQLAEARDESARRQEALAMALQQLRAARLEIDSAHAEAGLARDSRELLLAQMQAAQIAAATAQDRLTHLEADHQRLALRVDQMDFELAQRQKQLDAAHAERNELCIESAHAAAELAELRALLQMRDEERSELELKAQRSAATFSRTEAQLCELQEQHAALTTRLAMLEAEFDAVQDERAALKIERDQLADDVGQDHDLTNFLAIKAARDRFENEWRDTAAVLTEAREKLHRAIDERDTLRRTAVDLSLKLSALRDAANEFRLQQENEALRGIIERQNDELKERPAPAKRRRHRREVSSRVGDAMRAVWARCFISDPDAI